MFNPDGIEFLQRPWISVKKKSHSEAVFVLLKSNYKDREKLGTTVPSSKRFGSIFDTGARSRFIRLTKIPQLRRKIPKTDSTTNVSNAIGKAVLIVGTVDLVVQIKTSTQSVTFLVTDQAATSVILGYNLLITL